MKALGETVSLFCKECGGRDLVCDQDSGEVVCRKCARPARRAPAPG